ncbi:MAG: hypothetical protein WBM50_07225 [Acidimicrobiales bacterium]
MQIPVFVSRPSQLDERQIEVFAWLEERLESLSLQPRTLGSSDFAVETPLREVLVLARHCAGGIILGFDRVGDRGSTPWNQLEAGILYGIDLPLLLFADPLVPQRDGGIFAVGSSDLYVGPMPYDDAQQAQARETLLAWQGRVRQHYYSV